MAVNLRVLTKLLSNTWQQIILFILIMMGSAIFVSSAILHIRKRAFEKKFAELIEKKRKRLQRPRTLSFSWSRRRASNTGDHEAAIASGAVRGSAIQEPTSDPEHKTPESTQSQTDQGLEDPQLPPSTDQPPDREQDGHIRFQDNLPAIEHTAPKPRVVRRHRSSFFEGRGVGARGLENHPRHSRPVYFNTSADESAIEDDDTSRQPLPSKMDKYLDTVNGYLGRNSQFHNLSEKERKKLGGIEYDAIYLLSWVVPAYFFLWQLLGALGVGAWIKVNRPGMALRNGKAYDLKRGVRC